MSSILLLILPGFYTFVLNGKKAVGKNQVSQNIFSFPLEGKTVLWLGKINKYIIAENKSAELIVKIGGERSNHELVEFCAQKLHLTPQEAQNLVDDYRQFLQETYESSDSENKTKTEQTEAETKFYSKKYYRINEAVFSVEYETEYAEFLNHPKFAHHEINELKHSRNTIKVFDSNEIMSLVVNNRFIGCWKRQENHFLTGKFSMEILQLIHENEEKNWLGVLHAAGISDGKRCIIFFGDSGNGKSTLSAILMANGYNVLADDFLPVEKENNHVCKFPSAISVKKEAFELLMPVFAELKDAEQYENPLFNKTFRYLAQKDSDLISVPATTLVFIKYSKNSGFNLAEFSKIEALTHLIPDSWIEPSPENAKRFIAWISSLKCYRLTYSDNNKLVSFVKNEFEMSKKKYA